MIIPTNKPAFYFPLEEGTYEIKPGLARLKSEFGNGVIDTQVFQFDNQFHNYHKNKLKARKESLEKYVCLLPGKDLSVINNFIVNTLSNEQPAFFSFDKAKHRLECHLTVEKLYLENRNNFDALAMQLQEDLAVMEVDNNGDGTIIALHLCAPNLWAAEDKIGQDFITVHSHVPGMERIQQRNREINKACLTKGPFVRFAWGLSTDKYLNHHPHAPAEIPDTKWHGRQFNTGNPELYLRVERQTLNGFEDENLVLFTIRTYFYDVMMLEKEQQLCLLNAVLSMSEDVLSYKGLTQSKSDIIHWLEQLV